MIIFKKNKKLKAEIKKLREETYKKVYETELKKAIKKRATLQAKAMVKARVYPIYPNNRSPFQQFVFSQTPIKKTKVKLTKVRKRKKRRKK